MVQFAPSVILPRQVTQGKLEILLHGEKLRGSWTLMRIRGRDARKSGKTWFLMKHRDDEARPAAEYDITEDRPTASSASSRRRAARASTWSVPIMRGPSWRPPQGSYPILRGVECSIRRPTATMLFTQEEIVLDPATREQAEAAAPLMYDTDPHLFGYFFDGDQELALRYFAAQWRQERSLFSYRYCTVAVARGAFLGIEQGYDAKTQADVFRDTGRHAAQILTPEQMEHLRKAVNYIPFLVPPVPNNAYYVMHLASARDARGRGVGARLLGAAFDRARRNGYRVCQLDVASDNPAVRFYEQMGTEILSESRVLRLLKYGVASHYRMIKNL